MNGVRIGHESLTFVAAHEHIRPLRDHLIIEPLPVVLSETIAVELHTRPVRGKVLAVGPGHHPRRYNGRKGQRTRSWLSKTFQPTDVTVGDIVHFGDLERGGDLFPRMQWGDQEIVIVREADVTGIEHG